MKARGAVVAGLVVACCPGVVAAQVVQGVVIDATGRTPIHAAEVVLLGAGESEHGRTLSDSTGRFRLRLPEHGRYAVRVTHAVYATFLSDPLAVGPAETLTLEIRLGATAIPLDPIIVTARSDLRHADFHARRTGNAFGRFITRSDIERRPIARTTDLLRGIGGVSISQVQSRGRISNLITMRGTSGRCEPAIYVDGLLVRQITPIDDILMPGDIEGAEIYATGTTAPAQFSNPSGCGVILFWTRMGEPGEGRRMSWRRTLIGIAAAATIVWIISR